MARISRRKKHSCQFVAQIPRQSRKSQFDEKQIAPAEPEAAIRDANTYLEYIERMTHALVAMRERWKEKAFAHAAQK
jgi:hypothetical protein